jgi:DNA polymerase elongation subunit (family B)
MSSPRIVIWDVENSHSLAAIFSLYNDYISHENIVQEKFLICAAWKELGETKVHTVSILDDPKRFAKNPHDDYHVIKTLHKVLSEADVIVAHNGDQFDIKLTEGRMLYHGLYPYHQFPVSTLSR